MSTKDTAWTFISMSPGRSRDSLPRSLAASLGQMDGFLKTRGLFLPDTMEGVVADSQTAIAFSR